MTEPQKPGDKHDNSASVRGSRSRGVGAPRVAIELPPAGVDVIAQRAAELVLEQQSRDAAGWPEWMSVETAARYLDVSEERVRKLVQRRQIPYVQEAPGHRVFFHRPDLDAWMAELLVARRL
jgi:excisionase family DNA binding protein